MKHRIYAKYEGSGETIFKVQAHVLGLFWWTRDYSYDLDIASKIADRLSTKRIGYVVKEFS
jgi:hypothetical protein